MPADLADSSARALLALGLLDENDADQSLLATAIRDGEEDGRFTPGSIVAGRFRVTALVGRGGMGDVYRADDLTLGQPVALKFLPTSDRADAELVRLFYDEVRVGRQVAHPNVCRIYDLLEIEGRPAIVMEFVEGEDLASLLRRTGRLPYRAALQIARDICAGLEAAHDKRIVHGDLKPANVMIDGRGRARITDFGLARILEEQREITRVAGTPAYMAPEQFATGALTERGDIYSLGLVLYEVFAGLRPQQRDDSGRPALASPLPALTPRQPAIDPELERAILRCLDLDPQRRPSSVRSVRAAFPPGDILDSVLAAGETPPSEFVAESHKVRELTRREANALAVAVAALVIALAFISGRLTLYGRTASLLSPDTLTVRAREIAARVSGFTGAADEARWFDTDLDARFPPDLAIAPILFQYRAGLAPLLSTAQDHRIHIDQPPPGPGMIQVDLGGDGGLLRLRAPAPPPGGKSTDWDALLRYARLDRAALTPFSSRWTPAVLHDEKREWRSPIGTVRAAAAHGHVTWFETSGTPAPRGRPRMRESKLPYAVYFAFTAVSLVAGAFLARRNIRRRLVDVRAAWRVSLWVLFCRAMFGFVAGHHPIASLDRELTFVTAVMGTSLLLAAQVWLGYVALEPYVRRRWPEVMIGWARAIHGGVRDTVVGRDLLVGVAAGLVLRLLDHVRNVIAMFDPADVIPSHLALQALSSVRETIGGLFLYQARAIFYALFGLFVLLLLRLWLRRAWAASAIWLVAATLAWMRWDAPVVEAPVVALQMAIILFMLHRVGLLATTAAIFVLLVAVYTPITADIRTFFFAQSALALGTFLVMAAVGWYAATRKPPLGASSH